MYVVHQTKGGTLGRAVWKVTWSVEKVVGMLSRAKVYNACTKLVLPCVVKMSSDKRWWRSWKDVTNEC